MNVSSIELFEDPSMNWRTSYVSQFEKIRDDLMAQRHRGVLTPYYIGPKAYVPKELKDSQLSEIAWRLAERWVEHAIVEHDRKKVARAKRTGRAS